MLKDCDQCGNTRHIRRGKKFVRCICIIEELRRKKVAQYNTSVTPKGTTLVNFIRESLVVVGSVETLAPYIAGVSRDSPQDFTIRTVHAYDLVSSFFGESVTDAKGGLEVFGVPDLLIILLGFTNLTNKLLGDMLQQVYASRVLRGKSTWFVAPSLETNLESLYGAGIEEELASLRKLSLKKEVKKVELVGDSDAE